MAHGAVVDPDLLSSEDGDPVAVRSAPPPGFRRRRGDHGASRGFAVVDVDVVDDDVLHVLDGQAAVAGDVDGGAPAVDGFVAVDDEFVFEADEHVGGEDDPEGLFLDDGVAESSWGWV